MDSQGETKKCKHCGMDIPKQAKVCPYCNKKQKHTVRNVILIILGVLVLLGILFSCMGGGGNSNSDTSTTTSNNSTTTTTESTQSTPSTYTLGQTADVNGVNVTLNSAYQTSELDVSGIATPASDGSVFLVLNWTVVNNSNSDITVTQASFESYVDNATAEFSGYSIMIDGGFTNDLTLASGRETSGNIVYEIPAGWQIFETEYKPNMFLNDSANFQLTPNQVV